MTINKKNFRSTLAALAFGALVTAFPASATTIALNSSSAPTTVMVGGYDWSFSGNTTKTPTLTLPTSGGINYNGGTLASEFGEYYANGDSGAKASQSEVIDINVVPTINGVKATTAVEFQGSIDQSGNATTGYSYSLVFGNNGSTACANPTLPACYTTANGNTINNGQQVITSGALSGDTILSVGGIEYAVQTSSTLYTTKGAFLNGFIGVVVAPEPATFATAGLAFAFLGLFLRRKAKQNS